jgi:hypothetical protein
MRRGLPSFGTVCHHPSWGGDNRTYRNESVIVWLDGWIHRSYASRMQQNLEAGVLHVDLVCLPRKCSKTNRRFVVLPGQGVGE